MEKANKEEVYELLDKLQISYEDVQHQAVFTVAEIDFSIDGTEVKNLLIKAKKSGNYYFVVCPSEKRLDMKGLRLALEEKQLSFASAEELFELLGLTPGSVTPLALPHDTEKRVQLVIDSSIDQGANIGFHPNTNTATVVMAFKDFQRYLAAIEVTPLYIEVPEKEE